VVRTKSKGSAAERELLAKLWQNQFAVLRVAGSGSTKFDACDLIAGHAGKAYAIEVKACAGTKQYVSAEQMAELNRFATAFGATALIAVKWTRKGWGVINASEMQSSGKHFGISKNQMKPLTDWLNEQTIGFSVH
jgi:Holliday junction resolvase